MSIIKDENALKGNWMKFEKVGDSIEGTLTDIRKVPNQFKDGELQTIYELKKSGGEGYVEQFENGDFVNVGSKDSVDIQLRHVQLGQIVGFKFIEERKNLGRNPTKIIQAYADKAVVDDEWLKEKEQKEKEAKQIEDITDAITAD